jgi:hypothetical protein
MSFTKVDLPDPEAPVTVMNLPRGNLTDISFKLFSLAPNTSIYLPEVFLILSTSKSFTSFSILRISFNICSFVITLRLDI